MVLHPIVSPEHLEMLHRVTSSVCRKRRMDVTSIAAQDLAATILARYQSGIDSEEALLTSFSDDDEWRYR